jgi:ATP-binding cassette, subfamily B, bacterial MsbA
MARGSVLPVRAETLPVVRRLWREWIAPHWRMLALIMVFIVFVAGATGLYPVLIKGAYEAFEAKNRQAILLAPFFVIGVTAVKGFSLYAQTVLTNRLVTRIEADMQVKLYGAMIDADLAQLAHESPAALTQRFTTDFAFIKEALTRLSTVFLRDVATIIALVATMLWIDPMLTLAAGIVVPFAAIPVARIGKKLRRVSTATQEEIGASAAMVSESLAGVRVAKAFDLEPYLKGRATRLFENVRDLKMKAANARARLDPLLEIGGGLAVAGVLVLIGLRIVNGETTIGDFTGFVTALLLAAQPIRAIGNLNAIVQEAIAALTRYYAIVDTAPKLVASVGAPDLRIQGGEVAFRNVQFRYRDDVTALEGVQVVAPAGQMTALVGRSGSGKSTLLALVPRLYDPTGGTVLIDGQDIREVSRASLRAAVAMVSQDVVLFDDTIAANIAFGRPSATRDEIEMAAKAAAAHGFISAFPEGYEARVGHAGSRLSGGERQRISLARAILKDAPILLLDEATSALDAESEEAVQRALKILMKGRTTLVIAHRLATVRDADQIVVMDAGRVVETGHHDALVAANGLYARLARLQFTQD